MKMPRLPVAPSACRKLPPRATADRRGVERADPFGCAACADRPAARGAHPAKVLHVASVARRTASTAGGKRPLLLGLDANCEIFDPLYKHDHLARPYKVVPNTAAAGDFGDGLTWTIRIKPGIYFVVSHSRAGSASSSPRITSIRSKRLIDPKLRPTTRRSSTIGWSARKDAIAAASKSGAFDYAARFEAQAIDRYTLRLKLTYPAYDLVADLTSSATAAVARGSGQGLRRPERLGDGEPLWAPAPTD